MKRLFSYTTLEILIIFCVVGLMVRAFYPTVSRTMSSFVNSIPRDL